jgi:hypothetical protein
MRGEQLEHMNAGATAEQPAQRWRVLESWIREQTRSRCADPIPHARLKGSGKGDRDHAE